MKEEKIVKIKRQLFDPLFVIQIDEKDVPARIARLDDNSIVAKIEGRGTYRIDVSGVGFWFVEKKAEPYEPDKVLPEIHGYTPERMMTAAAKALGQECSVAVKGFRKIQNFMFGR